MACMRRVSRTICRAALLSLISALSPSAAVEAPAGPLAALASPSFQEREKAQAELVDWARQNQKTALDDLLEKSRDADDPEVRVRCLNAVKALVNEEYQRDGEGFIGISMRDEAASVPGDAKPRSVVRVGLVQPGTAGESAGLRVNDLIVSLNDEVWPDGEASKLLQGKIRMLKPGAKVRLGIMREEKVLKLDVTLGRRPVSADAGYTAIDPEALERAAKEAYFRAWLSQRKAGK